MKVIHKAIQRRLVKYGQVTNDDHHDGNESRTVVPGDSVTAIDNRVNNHRFEPCYLVSQEEYYPCPSKTQSRRHPRRSR